MKKKIAIALVVIAIIYCVFDAYVQNNVEAKLDYLQSQHDAAKTEVQKQRALLSKARAEFNQAIYRAAASSGGNIEAGSVIRVPGHVAKPDDSDLKSAISSVDWYAECIESHKRFLIKTDGPNGEEWHSKSLFRLFLMMLDES